MIPTCIRQQNILWTVNNLSLTISSGKFEPVSKIKSCHRSRTIKQAPVCFSSSNLSIKNERSFHMAKKRLYISQKLKSNLCLQSRTVTKRQELTEKPKFIIIAQNYRALSESRQLVTGVCRTWAQFSSEDSNYRGTLLQLRGLAGVAVAT